MATSIRRRTLLAGAIAGAVALGMGLRPADRGRNHNPWFESLGDALDRTGAATPTLVIDRTALLNNVRTLRRHIVERFDYRIVVKSLPSIDLLDAVMSASGSQRLMVFHQPFLNRVALRFPDSDVLLGKPMPVAAAARFYKDKSTRNGFDPDRQLQWLIDTPRRLSEYAALAEQLDTNLRINIELDIGLHRGGVADAETLIPMLDTLRAHPRLELSGFMGYEPHIVKLPGNPARHRDKAMVTYDSLLRAGRQHLGADWPQDLLLNCGGSLTYQLYDEGEYPFNELAAGSGLVMPTDFDIPTLADHRPASWIATPVLKALDRTQIPGMGGLAGLMAAWDPNRARSFFIYGGYWKARPESPAGLSPNPLMGRSTNQEMLNGSASIDLQPDDWVFLRPAQSEFVFLQFGDIAVLEGGVIDERWPVFPT